MTDTIDHTFQQIEYRDVYDTVFRTTHSEQGALKALTSAITNGDETRAKAIRAYAKTQGWDLSISFPELAETTQNALLALYDEYKEATKSIRQAVIEKKFTPEYARELLGAEGKTWTAKLDTIAKKADAMIQVAIQTRDAALAQLTQPKGSTQDQLLTEMKVSRAWDRIKLALGHENSDGALYSTAFGQLLSNTTDPYELEALLTEGPTYLRVNGIERPNEFIRATLAQVNPTIASALAKASEADEFGVVLHYNVEKIRQAVTSDNVSTTNLNREGWVDMTNVDYAR